MRYCAEHSESPGVRTEMWAFNKMQDNLNHSFTKQCINTCLQMYQLLSYEPYHAIENNKEETNVDEVSQTSQNSFDH